MILRTAEEFRDYEAHSGYLRHNRIHIQSVSPEKSVVTVDVSPDNLNTSGFVHGGLFPLLIDVAASQTAMADDRHYVTQNALVSYLSNVREGTLSAESELIKRGKKTVLVRVQVFSDQRKLLADATVTMMCTD